jgi:hypothetical protein
MRVQSPRIFNRLSEFHQPGTPLGVRTIRYRMVHYLRDRHPKIAISMPTSALECQLHKHRAGRLEGGQMGHAPLKRMPSLPAQLYARLASTILHVRARFRVPARPRRAPACSAPQRSGCRPTTRPRSRRRARGQHTRDHPQGSPALRTLWQVEVA